MLFIAIIGLPGPSASTADLVTAWSLIIFFGLLGSATAAIGYRLARGVVSENRITTMPVWFIQGFGVLFLVGSALIGFDTHEWITAFEASCIGFAMILISREVARRSR
jgi:hypothetical protein